MALRVIVHGYVQGVFFRASARELARRLGVTGWIRNDPGGTVTAHVEGPEAGVDQLLDWIRSGGPDAAHVTAVDTTSVDDEGHAHFVARH